MKQLLAILSWCVLGIQCSVAQQNCTQEGTNQKCETVVSSVASGVGKNWGPWYTLTSTAPAGLTYKWAEGNIDAPTNDQPHRCGVAAWAQAIQDFCDFHLTSIRAGRQHCLDQKAES